MLNTYGKTSGPIAPNLFSAYSRSCNCGYFRRFLINALASGISTTENNHFAVVSIT